MECINTHKISQQSISCTDVSLAIAKVSTNDSDHENILNVHAIAIGISHTQYVSHIFKSTLP